MGVGRLSNPSDIFIGDNGLIYLVDSGNNRIICMNRQFVAMKVYKSFDNNGQEDTFNNPQGIFVNHKGIMYIADTNNNRLVILDSMGNLVGIIGNPKDDPNSEAASILPDSFIFAPVKLIVDKAERIYVVVDRVYDGIMEFDSSGVFRGFIGANKVTFNFWDMWWKRYMMTEQQAAQQRMFIPTEFTNLDIDSDGFIFTTTAAINQTEVNKNTKPIMKLNAEGTDVLRRGGYSEPVGDLEYIPATVGSEEGTNNGVSTFIDVAVEAHGIYNVLDSRKGRVFTYDQDGNLLSVFGGGSGFQIGSFRLPVAVEVLDDLILVLDKNTARITVFQQTAYGKALKDAVILHDLGKYDESAKRWEEVLHLNANNEMAYIGIGKTLMREGKYEEAMRYFRLGNNRDNYSKAFKAYRKIVVAEKFGTFMTVFVILIVAIVAYKKVRKVRHKKGWSVG